jgi:hypothetical protein
MKQFSKRRLLTALVCLLLAALMLFTACKPTTPPDENNNENNNNENNPPEGGDEPVDDKFVKLSDKGNSLYNATYQTMLDRLNQNGYAQTSLTGTYNGMFVRDASIQVMAHIAEGDMDAAMSILKYMAAYHKAIGAEHAIHIMDALPSDILYDFLNGKRPPASEYTDAVAQMDYGTGLYKVVLPSNQAAQEFKVPFDNISEIAIALDLGGSKTGTLNLSIGTEPGDGSVAAVKIPVQKAVVDGKWVKLLFETPVTVTPGQTYFFTIGAEGVDGNVVAYGKLGGGGANNYDLPAYGGWIKESHSIAYQIRPDESITGQSNAATQTFTAEGDRIDTINVIINTNEKTAANVTLADASGKALKTLKVDLAAGQNRVALDIGLAVTEGAQYKLTIWTESGKTSWQKESEESHSLKVLPEYSGSKLPASVTVGGNVVATQTLDKAISAHYLTSLELYMAAVGTVAAEDTVKVTLYKGNALVDAITIPLSTLTDKAKSYTFQFCLPLTDTAEQDAYVVEISASREGSVKLFGKNGADTNRPVTLGDKTQDVVLAYVAGATDTIKPLSAGHVQVDGHYMWMNSFAMFVLEAEANYKGQYDEFIKMLYPFMEAYTFYFFETEGAIGGKVGFIDEKYGLMYTPSYEHSRDGRYWQAFDLITNVFCSEAAHKMSRVAKLYGTEATASKLVAIADSLADAIHDNLTADFNGKTIYIDLIDVENGKHYNGFAYLTDERYRVYKGFSFVNLAPLAADWYAMNDDIMKNTYEAYYEVGSEKYGKYQMLGVVVNLDKEDNMVKIGNHVIGKGFAWELFYNWKMGNTERVNELISFMEKNSAVVYPEVWRKDGSVSDSANQEHANWILYTMARITGKYEAK